MAKNAISQDIGEIRLHDHDTGSVEFQTKALTDRIASLNKHFGSYAKDFSAKRGMTVLLSRRRKLLAYLRRTDVTRYEGLIARLGLRK